ncbi:hypothetical protein NC651_036833 [Populus alba x Populus x berolinensis]|nr:hypothetical protein NC651_036833 [Populus alba x Populus x berolinensis]
MFSREFISPTKWDYLLKFPRLVSSTMAKKEVLELWCSVITLVSSHILRAF